MRVRHRGAGRFASRQHDPRFARKSGPHGQDVGVRVHLRRADSEGTKDLRSRDVERAPSEALVWGFGVDEKGVGGLERDQALRAERRRDRGWRL